MDSPTPPYPLLAFDTSSRRCWVGLAVEPNRVHQDASVEDPSRSLFALIQNVLRASNLSLADVASIAYCQGPGSILGARTSVMAIRTWSGIGVPGARSLFAYSSLQLGAELVARRADLAKPCLIATDARRDSWNVLACPSRPDEAAQILATAAFEADPRPKVTFPEFARWSKSNTFFTETPYDPGLLFGDPSFQRLLRPTDTAIVDSLRQNEYRKWTPKFHTAPSA